MSTSNSSDSPPENAVRVLRQFRIVFNAVRNHFRQVERVTGIGGAQLWALAVVSDNPGVGVTELANALDVHQSTASNLVRALATRKLIETRQSASDRRAVSLHVTATGATLLQSAPGPFSGILPAALAQMKPAQLARLERDLATLIEALTPDDEAGQTPLADL